MEEDTDLGLLMTEIPGMSYRKKTLEAPELADVRRSRQDRLTKQHAQNIVSRMGSVLYAVRTNDGLIKIGYTDNLYRRLSHFSKHELLAFRFGNRDDEHAVHESLKAHAAQGREYYHPSADVLAAVNQWREDLGMEPLP